MFVFSEVSSMKPMRQQVAHEGLAPRDPDVARLKDVRPLLLDGLQVFFCVSGRGCAGTARPRRGGW
jgi:hypothetical protein